MPQREISLSMDSTTPYKSSNGEGFRTFAKQLLTSPLLFSIVVMLGCAYFNSVMQVFVERRRPIMPVLPDAGFESFPFISYTKVTDIWVIVLVVCTFVRYLLTDKMVTISRRFFLLQGLLFLLRGISITITILPNPLPNCQSDATGNPFVEAILIMSGTHHTCGDVLFSGHSVTLTYMTLVWQEFPAESFKCCGATKDNGNEPLCGPAGQMLVTILVWLYAVAGFFLLIATHFHYSVDVFIGFGLCLFVYKYYHQSVQSAWRRNTLWKRFVAWFEGIDEENQAPLLDEMRDDDDAGMA